MAEAFMEINFKEVQRLTEEMKSTAEKIRRETDLTGMEILSATKAAWISSNADIFAGKEVKVLERIGEISSDLDRLSNDIFVLFYHRHWNQNHWVFGNIFMDIQIMK